MTSGHIYFIPSIFLLGFFVGAAVSNFLSQKKNGESGINITSKIRASLLASTFGLLSIMFVVSHMIPFPGGAKSLHVALGHQPLFDQETSSTADEVYGRIESFGDVGRETYKQFTYSGDVIFPVSLLAFLTVLAYFVRERTSLSRVLRSILISIPIFWFLFDMTENSVIYFLISQYPQKNIFLAGHLSTITNLKFSFLLGSIALPAAAYALFRRNSQSVGFL